MYGMTLEPGLKIELHGRPVAAGCRTIARSEAYRGSSSGFANEGSALKYAMLR